MNKLYILLLSCSFLLLQCTPKTGDKLSKGKDKMEDKAKEGTDMVKETVGDFRSNAPAPGPARNIEIGSYETFKLDNGLQVIVVENNKLPRVSFRLFVDAPPQMEKEYAGAVSMAGQLLKTGTKSKSKGEIDESIDYLGSSLNTNSRGMFGASLSKHADALLTIMSDVLMNPSFPEAEFEKLKNQTMSGLASSKDDPDAISNNVAQVLRYGKNHPYGEVVTETTVEQITLDKCKDYYNTYFKPNISYLVVVGDISVTEARGMAVKHFGKWKGTYTGVKPAFPMNTKPMGTQVDFVNKTGAVQSVIKVTNAIDLKPGAPDAMKAQVMNTMLGSFFNSRLMQNLREDKAYTYGAYSSLRPDKLVGNFSAGASVRNEVTDSAIVEFMSELTRIVEEDVTEDELQFVKNAMNGDFAISLEKPETIARFALNTARYNLPKDYYANYLSNLSKVTIADVRAMAKKYMNPENTNILVVGSKDEVADKLTKFSKDGEVTFLDYLGNPIEAPTATIPEGLTAQNVLDTYIEKSGGAKKWKKVKTSSSTYKGSVQGMTVFLKSNAEGQDKMSIIVEANMMKLQEVIMNGDKGIEKGMQGSRELDAKEVKEGLMSGGIIAEMFYDKNGVKTELKSIEKINGTDAYLIESTLPTGKVIKDYYAVESGLKVRNISTQDTPQGEITSTVDMSDYVDKGGFMVPSKLKVAAGPQVIKFELKEASFNGKIDAALFEVK